MVCLGNRAAAILDTLVRRAGDAVSREELMRRVGANVIVSEGDLRIPVADLHSLGLRRRQIQRVNQQSASEYAPYDSRKEAKSLYASQLKTALDFHVH
jgi:DNA-binding response OmpR family regulator